MRNPGKTLDEQIEGDHAYRDEPPAVAPPEEDTDGGPATCYVIHPLYGQPGTGGVTWDADEAEEASRNGHRVTAETYGYDL